MIAIENILPNSHFTCFVIPSLFSKLECEDLLNSEIKHSFQKANVNYPTYYRNNERFVVDNDDLARQLFEKVKPYLPEKIEIDSNIQSENGVWHLKELNNRIRFCKYAANQYFHRHLDGVHYRNDTTQSKLTFMIYLNSATEFEGGRTLFFKSKETKEIWASYIPKQGDLIVFDHNVWHEGEVLTSGEKFVLRSDILYSRDKIENKFEPFSGHLGYIWSLLKFDDNTILSGGRDKEIKVWNSNGEQLDSLHGHQNSILCIEKINDTTFVSGSRDKKIIIWKDCKIYKTIENHLALVLSLCRLDAMTFVSSSGDNTIKIFNLEGEILKTLSEHTNWVWQVIKLDEAVIASSSEDGSIKIWNCEKEKSIITLASSVPVISLAYNPKSQHLISGDLQGEITIRILKNNYEVLNAISFKAHEGIIRTIKVINEHYFATGGEDNKVKLWNIKGELIKVFEHQNFVQTLTLLNAKTLMSGSYDGTIKLWEL